MEDTFSVGTVARRLGVAAPTLRTWERRYRLGPSGHSEGGHRRYTRSDIDLLEQMHRLVTEGLAPGEAAAVLRAAQSQPVIGRSGFPDSPSRVVRGLLRAARDLDGVQLAASVRSCLDQRGVVPCWTRVLVPLMQELGESWERKEIGIASEHLAAAGILVALTSHGSRQPPLLQRQPPVLLAAAENDAHSLALFALQAALLERRVACQLLGGAVPRRTLAAAVRRTGPRVVFLWSSTTATGGAEGFRAVPSSRSPAHVVLGGPGWDRTAAAGDPRNVRVVDTLAEAVDLVVALVSEH